MSTSGYYEAAQLVQSKNKSMIYIYDVFCVGGKVKQTVFMFSPEVHPGQGNLLTGIDNKTIRS